MHPIARILAVAYIGLAVLAAGIYAQMTATYVDVAQIQTEIGRHVEVTHVAIRWSGNTSQTAHVFVYVNVTNPGRIPLGVRSIWFALHMDDPYDNRSWADPLKLDATLLQEGGIDRSHESPIPVAPGETRVLESDLAIDPSRMDKFNRPDANGRFHPVIWDVLIGYTLLDGRLPPDYFYIAPYYAAAGVVPDAP